MPGFVPIEELFKGRHFDQEIVILCVRCGMLPWDLLTPIFNRWIPIARVLHPYPMERFIAIHPRWEPYA